MQATDGNLQSNVKKNKMFLALISFTSNYYLKIKKNTK